MPIIKWKNHLEFICFSRNFSLSSLRDITMPRYYCDYCDTYLTHDSPSVRKQHNAGYKHKANVRSYYQQFEEQQTQSLIDQRIKEHLGQAAAYHQVGATFNQHLMSLQGNPQRPRLPILPPPILPMGASLQGGIPALHPGMRPPVLPLPVGSTPGYGPAPTAPLSMLPPGATSMPMQMNNMPRPPMMNPPPPPPPTGMATTSTSNGAAMLTNPATYQANPSYNSGAGASPAAAPSQEGFTYNHNSETNN